MWYIFLFSFVLCVSSESKSILTVHKNEYSERKCYGSSNLREGQAAFIDFKVNYSLKTIENCDRLIGDGELNIRIVVKEQLRTRYVIENVTSSMNGTWKCEVLEDGVCIIVIQVVTNELMVTVNEEPLTINWNKTDAYDGFVAYKFIENELAKIAFISKESGKMKFEQIDDGIETGYINEKEIIMYIKLSNNHDGKFIDCFYQLNGKTSIVRILLEQQETNPSLNQRDYNTVLTGELPRQVTCPKEGYNYTLVTLDRMNTAELKGLQSRNILYHYTDANYRLIIHYEYESNDHLNISWYVLSKTGMKTKHEVTWKDEAVMSPFEVRPEINNHLNMTVPTIRPHNNDDRTVIKFITSIDDGFSTKQNETWIILRLKTNDNTPEESKLQGDLDLPIVRINFLDIKTNFTKSETYDAIGTYFFYENELAEVNCTSTKEGMLKLEVKDEPNLMEYINETEISMYMRMRAGTEEKYVDCCFKESDEVSVVRIILKPMETNEDQNIWKIKINEEILPQRNNLIEYHYIMGDEFNVSCTKNGDLKFSGAFTKFIDSEIRHPVPVKCPHTKINSTNIVFSHIFTEGLQDLPTRGLLYYYSDNTGRRIMHYEYDKEDLKMTWAVMAEAGKINEYHVVWKDELMNLALIRKPQNDFALSLRIPTISPRYDDDRTTIHLWKSSKDDETSTRTDIVIVLRRKSNDMGNFEDIQEKYNGSGTDTSIAVGVGAIIFIILLVVGSWWIRRKLGARKNASRKGSNDNVMKDDVIPTSTELYTYEYIDTDKCRLNCSKARSMDKNNDPDSTGASTQEQIYSYVE